MISNRITSIFPRVSRVISPAADASYRSTRLRFFPLSSRERLCPTFTRFRRAVSHLFSPDAAASSPWTRRGTKRSARPAPASVVRARAVLRIPRPAIFGNETAWPRVLPAGTRKGEPASFFGGRSGPAALTRGEISWILWSLTNFEHRFSNESSIIRARLFFFWSKYEKNGVSRRREFSMLRIENWNSQYLPLLIFPSFNLSRRDAIFSESG